jgi:hypothetical protein
MTTRTFLHMLFSFMHGMFLFDTSHESVRHKFQICYHTILLPIITYTPQKLAGFAFFFSDEKRVCYLLIPSFFIFYLT